MLCCVCITSAWRQSRYRTNRRQPERTHTPEDACSCSDRCKQTHAADGVTRQRDCSQPSPSPLPPSPSALSLSPPYSSKPMNYLSAWSASISIGKDAIQHATNIFLQRGDGLHTETVQRHVCCHAPCGGPIFSSTHTHRFHSSCWCFSIFPQCSSIIKQTVAWEQTSVSQLNISTLQRGECICGRRYTKWTWAWKSIKQTHSIPLTDHINCCFFNKLQVVTGVSRSNVHIHQFLSLLQDQTTETACPSSPSKFLTLLLKIRMQVWNQQNVFKVLSLSVLPKCSTCGEEEPQIKPQDLRFTSSVTGGFSVCWQRNNNDH